MNNWRQTSKTEYRRTDGAEVWSLELGKRPWHLIHPNGGDIRPSGENGLMKTRRRSFGTAKAAMKAVDTDLPIVSVSETPTSDGSAATSKGAD